MGCAICLDDFDQADGESKRATALTCGHIFHYECLQTWFYGPTGAATHRHQHQKRCPLCSGAANPEAMVRLFPSDGNDLDTYLTGQQLWEVGAPHEDDQAEDHRNLKQLLNDLMDFNTAVQSYVMATHGVRCDRMVKAGVQVRKLFVDLAKDTRPDLKDALIKSMDALDNAASTFSTMFNDLSRRCRKNRKLQSDLLKEREVTKLKLIEAQNTNNIAAGKLREAEEKAKEVNERIKKATDMEKNTTKKILEIQAKEDELMAREQQLRTHKRKMEVENNLMLANMRTTTDAQLQTMRNRMEMALKKSETAEKDRQMAHNKSCELAEQMQQMQKRLKSGKKGAGSGPLKTLEAESDAATRRIKALEARNKAMEVQLKNLGIVTPEHRLNRGDSTSRTAADSVDLTRSSSPLGDDINTSPATPLDGYELSSQASASAAAASSLSPSAQRKGKKRARSSLSVEPERLDDEMDEAHFPMPGFGGLQMPVPLAQHLGVASRATPVGWSLPAAQPSAAKRRLIVPGASSSVAANGSTGSSTANEPTTPSRNRNGISQHAANCNKKHRKSSVQASDSNTGTSAGTRKTDKPNQHTWLTRTNGIVLGPKRRSKAS